MSSKTTTRDSNFELLRLVAMFCIVFYHLLLFYVVPVQGEESIFYALQLPLHIGVLLFVFISGYFGIKPSLAGGGKLLLMTVVYFLPLQMFHDISTGEGLKQILKDVLVLSHGHYWFIRTYLQFYLFVPIVNIFLEHSDMRRRIYTLVILAFINFWFGAIVHGDPSLLDGKNIVNFTFLYILGNTVRSYRDMLGRIRMAYYATAFVVLNLLLVVACFCSPTLVKHGIMRIAFGYNSPLLTLNAMLLFLVFSKLHFKSNVVNSLASSVFAIYLITCQPLVQEGILRDGAEWLMANTSSQIALCGSLMAYTLVIMIATISIDKILSPIWSLTSKLPKKHL